MALKDAAHLFQNWSKNEEKSLWYFSEMKRIYQMAQTSPLWSQNVCEVSANHIMLPARRNFLHQPVQYEKNPLSPGAVTMNELPQSHMKQKVHISHMTGHNVLLGCVQNHSEYTITSQQRNNPLSNLTVSAELNQPQIDVTNKGLSGGTCLFSCHQTVNGKTQEFHQRTASDNLLHDERLSHTYQPGNIFSTSAAQTSKPTSLWQPTSGTLPSVTKTSAQECELKNKLSDKHDQATNINFLNNIGYQNEQQKIIIDDYAKLMQPHLHKPMKMNGTDWKQKFIQTERPPGVSKKTGNGRQRKASVHRRAEKSGTKEGSDTNIPQISPTVASTPTMLPIHMEPMLCEACPQIGLYLCAGCQKVAYCSSQCQLLVWKNHKPHCQR